MKIACLTAAVTVAFASSAFAADLAPRLYAKAPPAPPASTWTGFYIGAEGGAGWGSDNWQFNNGRTVHDRLSGGLAGGVVGYNWQLPNSPVVLGLEGSFDWASLEAAASCPNPNFTCSSKLDQLYSGTVRLGYTWESALFFAKGGYAWTQQHVLAKQTALLNTLNGVPIGNDTAGSAGRSGWTIGGGVEVMFAPNWSVKAEYDYYDFGSSIVDKYPTNTFFIVNPFNERINSKLSVQTVKAGINYHFNWESPLVAR